MTKHKVVLVPFPFDDLSSTTVRPAVCLTDLIVPHEIFFDKPKQPPLYSRPLKTMAYQFNKYESFPLEVAEVILERRNL